ncbi:MAG TPA: hypothetical protein QF355_06895, partial [Candidatus Marinimicrobia bacterium]|nr:hypothetical protein [Candidatus Neomarinimicrobiota bacterium]
VSTAEAANYDIRRGSFLRGGIWKFSLVENCLKRFGEGLQGGCQYIAEGIVCIVQTIISGQYLF